MIPLYIYSLWVIWRETDLKRSFFVHAIFESAWYTHVTTHFFKYISFRIKTYFRTVAQALHIYLAEWAGNYSVFDVENLFALLRQTFVECSDESK
jgi:hypothetical protein